MFYAPLIPQDLYFIFGLTFLLIGLFSLGWLLFFVEHSRELPQMDRIKGTVIRLIAMSSFMGFGSYLLSLIALF